ncbi:MAG: phytanoyl-CoA dioxygenase family protein, partial [Halioglobus sp.]
MTVSDMQEDAFAISERQKAFFDLFGFLSLPALFAADIGEISHQFHEVFRTHPGDVINWVHEFHDNRARRFVSAATEKNAYLAGLLEDNRIVQAVTGLLGPGYNFTGSDVSIYDCGTRLHQDGHSVKDDSRNIKLALYLDPIDDETGAVRVIPGSHHRGDKFSGLLNRDLFLGGDKLGLEVADVPAVVLDSQPGDLLLWDYRLLHATAYGATSDACLPWNFPTPDNRRVHTPEYPSNTFLAAFPT